MPTKRGADGAVLPAAASSALTPVVAGAARTGTVVAVDRFACYVAVGEELVVVTVAAASRMPCALRLAPAAPSPDRWSRRDEPVRLGGGRLEFERVTVAVARWWSPVPILAPPRADRLAAWAVTVGDLAGDRRSGLAADAAGCAAVGALTDALRRCDGAAATAAADALLGRGGGSTPAGDDVLAGALVTLRLLGSGTDTGTDSDTGAGTWRCAGAPLADHVRSVAGSRTTWLSAALLRHAAAGRPLGELADVLRAVDVPSTADAAVRRLLGVGHTSGADLLAGTLLAAQALLQPAGTVRG